MTASAKHHPEAGGQGRICPASYRYSPAVFDRPPLLAAETLYVVGGLYGNVEALKTILAMKRAEESQGRNVTLYFNGDFNWFNSDPDSFAWINETVLRHAASLGNVEAELVSASQDAGCGCAYPAFVPEEVVERSNRIMARLRTQAATSPRLMARLAELPMQATVAVGDERIGIVHGDPESLAGWIFAVEKLVSARHDGGAGEEAAHPASSWARYFRQAKVRAFCSSHTCLPFAQDLPVDGEARLVINNGAAGMPNFSGTHFGLLTRISALPVIPATSIYGIELAGVRFDALPIPYDAAAWRRCFEQNWPKGSAAHRSYFKRIVDGPDFDIDGAVHGNVRRLNPFQADWAANGPARPISRLEM